MRTRVCHGGTTTVATVPVVHDLGLARRRCGHDATKTPERRTSRNRGLAGPDVAKPRPVVASQGR